MNILQRIFGKNWQNASHMIIVWNLHYLFWSWWKSRFIACVDFFWGCWILWLYLTGTAASGNSRKVSTLKITETKLELTSLSADEICVCFKTWTAHHLVELTNLASHYSKVTGTWQQELPRELLQWSVNNFTLMSVYFDISKEAGCNTFSNHDITLC